MRDVEGQRAVPGVAAGETATERLWTVPFVLALLSLFLFYGAFYLTLVALPRYLGTRLGSGAAQIGVITGLFSFAAMLPRPFIGRIADRGGAYRPMLGATTLPRLVVVRILHGTGMACFATASPTLVAALAPPARRAEAMGYWGMASTAALATFPALGLALAATWGYPTVFAAASLVSALSGVTVLLLRPRSQSRTPSPLAPTGGWLEGRVRLPAVAGLALATGNNVIVSFTVLLATERHIAGAGAFFAIFAAALFAYRIVGRRLADRYERWVVAVPGYACMGLGLVIASLAHAFPLLALTAVLSGIGLGAAQPALLALTVDLVPPERRGAAMATFYVAWELGSAASAIILGGAAQVVTYGGMFAIAGAIVLGTTVVLAFRLLPGARHAASVR